MKNGVFWDVAPCGSWKNLRFGELSPSIISVTRIGELGTTLAVTNRSKLRSNIVRWLLVTANAVSSSPILLTLKMEALRSSETSVLTRVRRRNIPEDSILHSDRRENLKSYMLLFILILCVLSETVNKIRIQTEPSLLVTHTQQLAYHPVFV
jgi:hypothetical protein